MELAAMAVFATLVGKFMDFLKYFKNKDWNGVATQSIAWAAGIAAVFLVASTGFGDISFGVVTLATATLAEKVVVGLLASSLISTAYDFKKAIDGSDSAKTPSLLNDFPEV